MAQTYTSHGKDLAIYFTSDLTVHPHSVMEIGGTAEVRPCDTAGSTKVIGVSSSDPAYVMNSEDVNGTPRVLVAVAGRTLCKVYGTCEPGDLLISTGGGYATFSATPTPGQIIGKALEQKTTTGAGIIEILVTLG